MKKLLASLVVLGVGALALLGLALRAPAPPAAPERGFALAGVNLVEPGGSRREATTLRVEGGRIEAIGEREAGADERFAGATVLPGLTDMHVHFPALGLPGDDAYTGLLLLAHGVTTVRIAGGTAPEDAGRLRAESRAGRLPFPRVFSCGRWLDGPEPVLPGGRADPVRFMTDADFAMVERAFRRMQWTAGRLHAAGIPLHTGTDCNAPNVVPGASLHRELELLVGAGLVPEQALALSTRASPAFLGVEGAGSLLPGAPADLAIFREDPTRDIAALATLRAVVRDGRLYTREELEARLAGYRRHYEGAGFQGIVMPTLRAGLRGLVAWLRD